MKLEWGFLKRNISIPKELKCINVDSKTSEFTVGQLEMMQKIASVIGVDNWSTAVVSSSITPVSGTKRFREMVKAFGNDNMEVVRQARQINKTTRKVTTTYKLLIYFDDHIFRVEIETEVKVTFNVNYMISIYDNQLQEMCNITCLCFLKKSYPYLYKLFIQCVEVPTLDVIENQIRERFKYCMKNIFKYKLQGIVPVAIPIKYSIDLATTPESTSVAEILNMTRVKKV